MPGQIDKVNINNKLFDWGSQELSFDNNILTGYTSITFDEKRERTKGWGAGRSRKPRGRTQGKYTPGSVKIKMYLDTWAALMKWAAARAGSTSYGDAEFPGLLQYVESGFETHVVKFEAMTIVGPAGGGEESPDPHMIEIEFDVMGITRDGLTLYAAS